MERAKHLSHVYRVTRRFSRLRHPEYDAKVPYSYKNHQHNHHDYSPSTVTAVLAFLL
jgi:hypothetical protein